MADEKDLNGEEQEMTVTLILDDDAEVECMVLTIFNAGGYEYITPLPTEGADSEEDEIYPYRYSEIEDGTLNLDNIEDGDEYETVVETFGELLDVQGYDELVGEVEEEQSE